MPAMQPRGICMAHLTESEQESTSHIFIEPVCFIEKKTEALRGEWDLPLGTVTEAGGEPGPLTPQAVSSAHATLTCHLLCSSPLSVTKVLSGMEQFA